MSHFLSLQNYISLPLSIEKEFVYISGLVYGSSFVYEPEDETKKCSQEEELENGLLALLHYSVRPITDSILKGLALEQYLIQNGQAVLESETSVENEPLNTMRSVLLNTIMDYYFLFYRDILAQVADYAVKIEAKTVTFQMVFGEHSQISFPCDSRMLYGPYEPEELKTLTERAEPVLKEFCLSVWKSFFPNDTSTSEEKILFRMRNILLGGLQRLSHYISGNNRKLPMVLMIFDTLEGESPSLNPFDTLIPIVQQEFNL